MNKIFEYKTNKTHPISYILEGEYYLEDGSFSLDELIQKSYNINENSFIGMNIERKIRPSKKLGVKSGGDLIKYEDDKIDWKQKGCNTLKDAGKKMQCKLYLYNEMIKNLQNSAAACKSNNCLKAHNTEISKYQQRISNLYN